MNLWKKRNRESRRQSKNMFCRLWTELTERLRLRRGRGDTSEDDEGLPRSPCNSPTATDKTAIKDNPKSHSTCSEASLLSVGSSEMDEDSFGQHSIHSSKLSLDDRNLADGEFDLDLGIKNSSAPLNHSGARHKASVKPQRRYGAPRKKRLSGSVLPTTPEVNEDATLRSITPEVNSTKAPGSDASKLNRSRSNAGSKYQEEFSTLGEEDEGKDNKKTDSFLGRIFPRRSGRKKKTKEEKNSTLLTSASVVTTTTVTSKQSEFVETASTKEFSHIEKMLETSAMKPIPIPRSGPAARQRIQPHDIPASPELSPRFESDAFKSSPDRSNPASPLHIELENHLQQRLASLSISPKSPIIRTPPTSPKFQRSPLISPPRSPLAYPKVPLKTHMIEKNFKHNSRNEEIRSKVIITGLSPFQQRAVANNTNEDDSDGFKSLTDLSIETSRPSKLVAKSHSFKITNNSNISQTETKTTFAALASRSSHEIQCIKTTIVEPRELKSEIKKTISLDSVQNPESLDVEICNTKKVAKSSSTRISRSNSKEQAENFEATPTVDTKEFSNKTTSADSNKPIVEMSFSESNESLNNIITVSETEEFVKCSEVKELINNSGITISGPRHKAIVSVTNHESEIIKTDIAEVKHDTQESKDHQVTKIQVKQESTVPKTVPEFMNIQLHKVEKPINNVILTAGFQNQKVDEQNKKTPVDSEIVPFANQQPNVRSSLDEEKLIISEVENNEAPRKFSKDDIEIIERTEIDEERKHVATALVTITTMTPPVPTRMYKKNDHQIRKSLISINSPEKPVLKTKSNSLDMVELKADELKLEEKEIKTKTQSVNDLIETANTEPNVPLRRKSMAKQRQDDEPELMKVFARRSLKLKDSDSESLSQQVIKMIEESAITDVKSRDSDKENQMDSPSEERKKIVSKEVPKFKEPLLETKFVESTTEVTMRKPVNNNNKLYNYQRTVSLNNAKTNDINYEKMQKQNSLVDRPKTDHWINFRSAENETCNKICQDEILTSISEKTLIEDEFCTKPKNFNQRKAEWEKRAQEASRKTTP